MPNPWNSVKLSCREGESWAEDARSGHGLLDRHRIPVSKVGHENVVRAKVFIEEIPA